MRASGLLLAAALPIFAAASDNTWDVDEAFDRELDEKIERKHQIIIETERDQLFDRADTTPWYKAHYDALTAGLTTIDGGGKYNSEVDIFAPKAFPVVVTPEGYTVIVGGESGKGRVVATGRMEWIFYDLTASMTAFVKNAVGWLGNGKANPRVASRESNGPVGIESVSTTVPISELAKGEIDIYCLHAGNSVTDEEVAALVKFVQDGGSLFAGAQAWWWGYSHTKFFTEHPGNKYLTQFGMIIGYSQTLKKPFPVSPMPGPDYNLHYAISTIETDPDNARAMNTIRISTGIPLTIEGVTTNNFMKANYDRLVTYLKKTDDSIMVSALFQRILTVAEATGTLSTLGGFKAPDVATFPGAVEDTAKRVTKTKSIDGNTNPNEAIFMYAGAGNNQMRSTELYAAPGDIVKVTAPSSIVGKTKILLGCHTDTNWHHYNDGKTLKRSPAVTITYDITKENMDVLTLYGGLIYITIPPGSSLGSFKVTIANAVKAPHFVLGTTTDEKWNTARRLRPAPWAELEVPGQIILSVPSSSIRELSNPTELMQFHDRAYQAANRFAGMVPRWRTERFAFDVHISAGWMHAGYPLMGFVSAVPNLINAEHLKTKGTWGYFHELGHNHQITSWTPSGCTETTNNWWSIIMNKEFGLPDTSDPERPGRIHMYVLGGKKFKENWSVWMALDTYVVLAQEFGWDTYTQTMATYIGKPKITDNDQKLNEWAKRYSNVVGRNLCPYFKWWGWPITAETEAECAKHPEMEKNLLARYEHPTEHGACDEGWIPYGNTCFFKSDEKVKWHDAEAKCAAVGAHLASCLTEHEFAFLAHQCSAKVDYWIGLHDMEVDNSVFVNLDGTVAPVDKYIWKGGRPDPNDSYHCVLLYNGVGYDWKCENNYRFICKKGPSSCGPVPAEASCPEGWDQYGENCYKFNADPMVWTEAQASCQAEGAFLAEITYAAEQNFVVDMIMAQGIDDGSLFAIGMKLEGGEKWTSGSWASYTNWCEGAPTEFTDSYGFLDSWSDGMCWVDGKDTTPAYYICEKRITF